ncbi:MAG TPA: hypothetical protein EYF95_05290 [Flavobacteriales bacterium]|jgi:hypothetical protein|nr:hypothetical protein [Flavobacteriales bacterium]
MSLLTTAARESDGGKTEITIADGKIYVDIFRGKHHIDQYIYEAKDLIDKNIDRILMSNGFCWSDFKRVIGASR